MDGTRPGPLSDAAFDRELDAAVNVDPSPEFVARVRTRIANETAPAPWRVRWTVLAWGAAAAVLAVAAMVTLGPTGKRVEPQQAVAPEVAVQERVAPPAPVVSEHSAPAPGGKPARPGPQPVSSPPQVARVDSQPDLPPFPEVLVSADEVRAYQMLLGIAEQQRLPASPPPARADAGVVELQDIQLASLTIDALPPLARLEGERP
jgi:hypothetical protein